jgi:hypothetical protein
MSVEEHVNGLRDYRTQAVAAWVSYLISRIEVTKIRLPRNVVGVSGQIGVHFDDGMVVMFNLQGDIFTKPAESASAADSPRDQKETG